MAETLSISGQKKVLRNRARAELKAFFSDKALAKQCSETVCSYLLNSELFTKAPAVFSFMAMDDEIDLLPAMKAVLESGKILAVPRMVPDSDEMNFYAVESLDSSFTTDNKYGIREPDSDCKKIDINDIPNGSFILVPGLAFNLSGARLGRGKGYYDRYLSRIPKEKKVILCGVTVVSTITRLIPVDKNDVKVDYLVNEYGLVKADGYFLESAE